PTMMTAGKFVVTPMEGRIRLAGIVEFGGLDAGPSEAPFALLERQARAAMPGLTWRETSRWMGHRPAPSDSLPLIGEVPGCRDVIAAFGHHHIGLTAGPKTGRFVSGMLTGQKTNSDLSAFDPSRFA
ncbi:MAG: NAD(P)/FAD-dependent oxidoreductase, partial [Pannonibacter phragmitetus]